MKGLLIRIAQETFRYHKVSSWFSNFKRKTMKMIFKVRIWFIGTKSTYLEQWDFVIYKSADEIAVWMIMDLSWFISGSRKSSVLVRSHATAIDRLILVFPFSRFETKQRGRVFVLKRSHLGYLEISQKTHIFELLGHDAAPSSTVHTAKRRS